MSLDERAREVWADVGRQIATTDRPAAAAIARRSRRGRVATGLATLTVLAVAAVGLAVALQDDPAPSPLEVTHDPEPSTTTTADGWTPERTRSEGSPLELEAARSGPSPSGLDAQLYCIGQAIPTGTACDRFPPIYHPEDDQHWALEVTQGGRSALFEVQGMPIVTDFDDDSLLVQDGPDEAVRHRLLQADGTEVTLRVLSDLAPAVPGPDVRLIEDLGAHRTGMIGSDGGQVHPYLVDERAGTLQRLDVPAEIEWWGPNVDEALWGGNGCRVIWQQPDGSFDHHDGCRNPLAGYTDPGWNWPGFADWLEPGRMALVEWGSEGEPRVVHASVDGGATWERIEIEDRVWIDSLQQIEEALADALRPLD